MATAGVQNAPTFNASTINAPILADPARRGAAGSGWNPIQGGGRVTDFSGMTPIYGGRMTGVGDASGWQADSTPMQYLQDLGDNRLGVYSGEGQFQGYDDRNHEGANHNLMRAALGSAAAYGAGSYLTGAESLGGAGAEAGSLAGGAGVEGTSLSGSLFEGAAPGFNFAPFEFGGAGAAAGAGAGAGGGNWWDALRSAGGAVPNNVWAAGASALTGRALRPDEPNYQQAATQQGQDNLNAAQVSNQMNRVDSNTPYGSQRFSRVADPSVPGGFRYTQDLTLSPEQQQLYNLQTQGQIGRGQMSNDMLAQLRSAYGQPFDFGQYGARQQLPGLDQMARMGNSPQAQGMQRVGGPQRQSYQGVGTDPYGTYDMASLGGGPQGQTVGQGPGMGRVGAGGPQARDLYGQTGYASSVDAVRRSVMDQFNNENRTRFEQDRAGLENRLKNMGLAEGTEAYDREMTRLQSEQGRQATDAAQRAIQMGGQEQSRLAGIDLAADEQRFGQQQISEFLNPLNRTGFNNAAGQQEFGNQLVGTGFNNQVGQQGYGNLMAALNQRNQARGQGTSDRLATAGFGNEWQRAGANDYFGQGLQARGFNNAAGQQDFGNQMSRRGFDNNALQQDMQNALTLTGFNNQNREGAIREGLMARGMPFQEYMAMQQGTGPTTPQFQPFGMAGVTPPPTLQGTQMQGQSAINRGNYNTATAQQILNLLSQGGGGGGGGGGFNFDLSSLGYGNFGGQNFFSPFGYGP